MYKRKLTLLLIALAAVMGLAILATPRDSFTSAAPTTQPQSVNVVNTPTVNAQQTGIWNVGISGQPTVNLANGTTVGVSAATPLPVRDVDNPARQPYFYTCEANFPAIGTALACQSPQVPAGKRLVVEQVSVKAQLTPSLNQWPDQKLTVMAMGVTNGFFSRYYIAGTDSIQVPGNCNQVGYEQLYLASSQMRIYGDPGTKVQVNVFRTFSNGGECDSAEVDVSGYLVDVP